MSEFVFRHFTVKQERSAMKIGTDSVLLGCICEVKDVDSLLDIGTGTGILALMLAQRCNGNIDAVETDELAAQEAEQNFRNSEWSKRLNLYHTSIQQYAAKANKQYGLIISNPPYYKAAAHSKIEDEQRSKARHDLGLPFEELISSVLRLLMPGGSFWLILPVHEAAIFNDVAKDKLHLVKQVNLIPKPGKPANRLVMQFAREQRKLQEEDLIIYDQDNMPSLAYKRLARDFYTGSQFKLDEE